MVVVPFVCSLVALGLPEMQAPAAPAAGASADDLGLHATQVTIRMGREQFRATVIAKEGETLTILTAAHCVGDRDVGSALLLRYGNTTLRGKVIQASHNPDYKPVPSRDPTSKAVRGVLCVDTALATIHLDPVTPKERQALKEIAAAELSTEAVLGTRIRTISVHIIDQEEREHMVTAGNHLNPKCLAWGRASYHPQPGDSGAGVFFVQENPGGKPRPVLVGNVALSDDRGGIAPIVSRSSHWVEEAFAKANTSKPR
jgi:hypothetical protein